jgi:ribosome-associated protein
MARKSRKGYYDKGEFVAAGSADDLTSNEAAEAASRTQRKNASDELQDLGEDLLASRSSQLAALSLPEKLQDALVEARRLTNFGAKRRQLQFIGKQMRRLDSEMLQAIRAALAIEHGQSAKGVATLHRAEQWRDSLIGADEPLGQWLADYPDTDAQQLRALIRQARKDAREAKPGEAHRQGRAYRQIFVLVRSQLEAAAAHRSR